MDKAEIRLLFRKAATGNGLTDSEFTSLFGGATNKKYYHDAIIVTCIAYLQAQMQGKPEAFGELRLLKETAELLLLKKKEVIDNWEKAEREARTKHERYCSFCSKSETEAKTLIAGTSGSICDECVARCAQIITNKKIVIVPKPRRKAVQKVKTHAPKVPKRRKQP